MKIVTILYNILQVILIPVYLVAFLLFILIWGLFTLTGIGPLLQYCCLLSDRKKLDVKKYTAEYPNDIRMIEVPAGIHGCSKDKSYKIFAIYSEPATPSRYPPICIPNGLGATAVLISQMQERLVEQGFTVLSFDRLGVGMSDRNESTEDPTAVDIVKEMDYVMSTVSPDTEKWILLGPSMGSIIAQCYISVFPNKVVGFLNMDGLPYPFFKYRSSFMWAAFIYRIYASIIWTGILRPFIGIALKSSEKMFLCKKFPLSVAVAQLNQPNFFGNVAKEMGSMMDCCEMAEIAWGKQSVVRIPENHFKSLVGAPPTISIEFDEASGTRNVTQLRSESELGNTWSNPEDVQNAVNYLLGASSPTTANIISDARDGALVDFVPNTNEENRALLKNDNLKQSYSDSGSGTPINPITHHSVLGEVWKKLVVRVMSARCHDFGNAMANSFYNQDMRNDAAAEHSLHFLLAADGARTCYPKINHTVMFSKTDDIVRNIVEIAHVLETQSGRK